MYNVSQNQIVGIAVGVSVLAVVIYLITRDVVADGVEAVSNVNEGTPYQGAGIVGTAGNIFDKLSGGTFSRFGSFLGEKTYNLLNGDPNAQ